jgi:hypothetical protein
MNIRAHLVSRKTFKGRLDATFKYQPRATEAPALEEERLAALSEKARLQRKVSEKRERQRQKNQHEKETKKG